MKITRSEEVYACSQFRIEEAAAVDEKTGWKIERSVIRHRGSAVMLAIDAKRRVLLERQYRLPADAFLWELPAGKLDEGETPLAAAKRELEEETGLRAKKWKKLTAFYPSPGALSERMNVFLATELTQGEPHLMGDERIETRWFTQREVLGMIEDGSIRDGKTIAGFLFWLRFGRSGEKRKEN